MITLIIVILHCLVYNGYFPFGKMKKKEVYKYYNDKKLEK